MRLIFVTGGARSGKSSFALQRAHDLGGEAVTFIATAQTFDDEMRERVALHRQERPGSWTTVEAPRDAANALRAATTAVVLLDCLSLLVSNVLVAGGSEADALAEVETLLRVAREREGWLILVTNEVGSGIVPAYPLGRLYRDALGRINQRAAAAAQEAYFVVAGLPLALKPER